MFFNKYSVISYIIIYCFTKKNEVQESNVMKKAASLAQVAQVAVFLAANFNHFIAKTFKMGEFRIHHFFSLEFFPIKIMSQR